MSIKNLKIEEDYHKMLKDYCVKRGLIMSKYLEKLIEKNCKEEKDIYGE